MHLVAISFLPSSLGSSSPILLNKFGILISPCCWYFIKQNNDKTISSRSQSTPAPLVTQAPLSSRPKLTLYCALSFFLVVVQAYHQSRPSLPSNTINEFGTFPPPKPKMSLQARTPITRRGDDSEEDDDEDDELFGVKKNRKPKESLMGSF